MVLFPKGKNVYQKSGCLDCDLTDDKKKNFTICLIQQISVYNNM